MTIMFHQIENINRARNYNKEPNRNFGLVGAEEFMREMKNATESICSYFCFIDYTKDFDCVDHRKLWKNLKEMGISDYLTCLLRNLHPGQEGKVRTGHGTDGFQIRKGI